MQETNNCTTSSNISGRTEFPELIEAYLKKGNVVKKFDIFEYALSTRRVISTTEDVVKRAMNGSGYENITSEVESARFEGMPSFDNYMRQH